MEAKDAVIVAKGYFAELFAEQGSLEEIWFDQSDGAWCVTLGVKRPPTINSIGISGAYLAMAYKVVRIRDKDGKPISVRNREGERAA